MTLHSSFHLMFDNKNSGLHGKQWKTMQEDLENLKLVIIGKFVTWHLVVFCHSLLQDSLILLSHR